MKKIISLLAAASMSALALVSCIKEDVKTTGETFTVNFLAQTPETKTIFGEVNSDKTVPTLWETGDAIALNCNLDPSLHKKAIVSTTDGTSATFSVDFEKGITAAEAYTFYAAYPYTQNPVKSGKVKITIPAVQTPVEGNIAKDAMGLVAKSETFTAKPTEPVALTFKHVAAYGCITKLDGVPAEANITAVKITSDNNIVGTFLSDCVSTTLDEDAASKSLTINTTAHENIWFSVAPFEGGNVKFEVITEDGTYVVEKDFTGRKFEAGKIAKFGITGFEKSGTADVVYTLVKSVDELVEGANVIIAALDYDRATGAIGTNSYSSEVAISRNNDNNILNPGNDVMILTVENGVSEGTYSLYSSKDEGYLCATTSGNNLKAQTNIDGFSSWNITISTEGSAIIKANGSNIASPFLRYNPGNTRFSCYKNTNDSNNNKNVTIYIDAKSVLPALGALTIEASKSGADAIEVIWTDVENATEYVVSCTGQTDQTVASGVEYAKFEGLADGDYVVTVTAKADGYKPSTASAASIHIGLLARELAFAKPSVTVKPGETFSNAVTGKKIDDVVYSITHKDGSAITDDEVLIEQDGTGLAGDIEGEYIIKATAPATEEYAAGEASYTLKVAADTTPGTGEGTEASPYSADRAYAKVSELSSTETLSNVYVSGIISKVDKFNSTYGSITYYISVDGTTTADQFQIYGGLSFNGEKFSALTDLNVGDKVVVCGTAKNYNGTNPELDVNSELISLNGKVALKKRNLAYTPATATITVGDAWTAPELTGDLTGATVSYSSDNTALATVASDGTISLVADATGTATITAIVAEDETYAEASATYTITVKEASQGGETVVEFNYSSLYSTVTGSSSQEVTQDVVGNVTMKYTKVSGSNPPKYYANGTNLRIYNKSTIEVSVPVGKVIKTIDFGQGTTTWATGKMSATSGNVKDVDKKWMASDNVNTVTLTITGSFRFTKIVVTYE